MSLGTTKVLKPIRFSERLPQWPSVGIASLCGVGAGAIATLSYFARFNLSTAGSVELLLVVLVALRFGFLPSTVASLVSLGLLNFLFTTPLFTFRVDDPRNWVALGTFEITALLVSRSSAQVRKHAAEVEEQRKRNLKLFEFSRAILLIDVQSPAAPQLEELTRNLIGVNHVGIKVEKSVDREELASQSASREESVACDSHEISDRTTRRVLRSGTTVIGTMVLSGWACDARLADAIASIVAIALERSRAIRKENQAEAERNAEQLRTAVLDGLAHGYKTPLTSIQAASSGLLAISQLTQTQTELVTIIDDQVTLLSKLTTRLLQTAALEGKEVKLKRRTESVASLIDDVIEQQDRTLRSRIHVFMAEPLRPVFADIELLKLALIQLVDNAAKYSTVNSVILISAVQELVGTTFVVSNEGSPIPEGERNRIFRRFYRGVDAAKGPTGTGLGLSIVSKAAEAHGGRAWVTCEGSTNRFSISIPHFEGKNR